MAPTFLKAGLVLLSQLHLAWALVPRAPTTSSLASNLLDITGTRADCIAWRKAQDGEDCTVFEKPFGLSQNEFIALNNKMDPVINKGTYQPMCEDRREIKHMYKATDQCCRMYKPYCW